MNKILSQILIYFNDFIKFISGHIGSIKAPTLASPSVHYSWLIILFFVFAIFLVGLSLGRTKMLISLLSLYIASFLEAHFVYFDKVSGIIKGQPAYMFHVYIFLLLYVLIFFIFNHSILNQRFTFKDSSLFSVAIFTILEIGLLVSLIVSYLPSMASATLPKLVSIYFGTKTAQFWWAVFPLVIIFFFKRKKESGSSS